MFLMPGKYVREIISLPEHNYVKIINHDEIALNLLVHLLILHVSVGSFSYASE